MMFTSRVKRVGVLIGGLWVCIVAFQNCSQFGTTEGGAAESPMDLSIGLDFQSLSTMNGGGGSGCYFSGDPNGWPSAQAGASAETLGAISLNYQMKDGSGSGQCRYDVKVAALVTPGMKFNVDGVCTDPEGKSFNSKGSLAIAAGNRWPYTDYNLFAGFGQCGQSSGDEIVLRGKVQMKTGAVSNVIIERVAMGSSTVSVSVIAEGTGGQYDGKYHFDYYSGWSDKVTEAFPGGSSCELVANPWGHDMVVMSASCRDVSGGTFALAGSGTKNSLTTYNWYELEGVAADGMTFVRFIRQSRDRWLGTWPNKQATGYGLEYFNSSGQMLGACSLGVPDSAGVISGNCLMGNNQFSISGNVGAPNASGIYNVVLRGSVNGVEFTATIDYNPSAKSGVGKWSAKDGSSGPVNATPTY